MRKILFVLALVLVLSATSAFASGLDNCAGNEVKLQIGNPTMNACGVMKELDEGRGTVPVIVNDYTLVPIRAVIEAFGGSVSWDEESKSVYVSVNDKSAEVTVDSTEAVVYAEGDTRPVTLEIAPKIINGRTMVPLRFVSESVGLEVEWNGDERIITITQPKSEPVKFANFDGEFYPIGDFFDMRMGGKVHETYTYGGEDHMIVTNIISTETVEWNGEGDFYDPEQSLSSIKVDGEEYKIHNVFNLEYVGVADLNPEVNGFEIAVMDNGVSDDLSVALYSFDGESLSYINTYSGTTYEYYKNGTGTVYCDGKGHIINKYIGFTEPMYAYSVDSFFDGGSGVTVLEPEVVGRELKFGRDLFAYYIPVDEYPDDFNDIWNYTDEQLTTIAKDTPVIIDKIMYIYDDETGDRYVFGYCARIDGSKYVIQLQYAG